VLENVILVVASLIIAGIMFYIVDKKFGPPNDGESLL
jgi:hypothetical protein